MEKNTKRSYQLSGWMALIGVALVALPMLFFVSNPSPFYADTDIDTTMAFVMMGIMLAILGAGIALIIVGARRDMALFRQSGKCVGQVWSPNVFLFALLCIVLGFIWGWGFISIVLTDAWGDIARWVVLGLILVAEVLVDIFLLNSARKECGVDKVTEKKAD